MTTSPSAQEKAQQTAATAADESKKVAGTARSEAQNVAAEAKVQVSSLMDQATSQVSDQSRTQRDRLVGMLHTLSDDLQQMAGQTSQPGIASDLVRQVSDRARSLGDQMDGREPTELLDDVRQFARRRPGTFLLGALAAGVAAGRLTRGAKAAKDASSGPQGLTYGDATMPAVAAPVQPVSPVPPPAPAPVPGSEVPTYSAPGVATPDQPVVGTHAGADPLVDPLVDPADRPSDVYGRDLR